MNNKVIEIENNAYELITNYRNGFDNEEFEKRYTDYFADYDYIVGDIAYSSLRLKGFYDSNNKKVNKINNYDNLNIYLKENCANDCRYFVLKKIDKE